MASVTTSDETVEKPRGLKSKIEAFFKPAPGVDTRDIAAEERAVADSEDEPVEKDAQAGVQRIQAAAQVWTTWHLIAAHFFIWLIYWVISLQEIVVRAMTPYVTSNFSRHSLTAATGIMSSIIGGLARIPTATILDTWGRPQGIALMTIIWALGFVMMAACKNVETYAAAQVFYVTGSQGVSYCVTVFISDTSTLRNRTLMLSVATSPYIVTAWLGGPISQSVLSGIGFRWGFGIFAIVVPVTVAPLTLLFIYNQNKAKKQGLIKPQKINLSPRSLKQYAIDVDLLGILILAAGMALFLLPFSLYSYQSEKWRSPMIICMITFGGALLIVFPFYERYLAPKTFIPFNLLLDRTVFFAGMMFVFVFFNSSVWGAYFYSMLQVVWGLSVTNATYVSAIYRTGSCAFAFVVGYAIRRTCRFKWIALYFCMPLMMLGVGLMIHFRQPNSDIGYIVMTQIFVAFAGGAIVLCGELAMMAPSNHQHIAAIIAILDLFGSIGSAAGGTVATAIWTSVFPDRLRRYLPAGTDISRIYGSITWQMAYKEGTPERDGINRAYGDAQRYMLITSLCLLGAGTVCVALWRDIKVDRKQTKGRVI
ncbi:MFS siderochrome iron transporter 1 [Exophiala dermatitidis]